MQQATPIQATLKTPTRTLQSSRKSTTPILRQDTRGRGSRMTVDDGWARRAMHASGFGDAGF